MASRGARSERNPLSYAQPHYALRAAEPRSEGLEDDYDDTCCGRPSTLEKPWGDIGLLPALHSLISFFTGAFLFDMLLHTEGKSAVKAVISLYDTLFIVAALLASISGAALCSVPSWALGGDKLAQQVGLQSAWWALFCCLSALLTCSALKVLVFAVKSTVGLHKGHLGESGDAAKRRMDKTENFFCASASSPLGLAPARKPAR